MAAPCRRRVGDVLVLPSSLHPDAEAVHGHVGPSVHPFGLAPGRLAAIMTHLAVRVRRSGSRHERSSTADGQRPFYVLEVGEAAVAVSRHALGLTPNCCWNQREKALRLAKPRRPETSVMEYRSSAR
jgi:hypothetical protein